MNGTSPLTLYKASAGSGKTFMLAVRYIAILVRNPEAYRHILAVTFTNKATAEMKQRILSQLYGISRSLEDSDAYFKSVRELVPDKISDGQIRRNADAALTGILQDYGHFRVETIDSFFQSVLKGLAHELQLGNGMSIELDTEGAISDAVDEFLANIDPKSKESESVLDFVQDNIDDNRNWNIGRQLKDFSKQLFSETFIEHSESILNVLQSPDTIRRYAGDLKERRQQYSEEMEERMMRCGEKLQSCLSGRGLSCDNLKGYAKGLGKAIADGTYLTKDEGQTINSIISEPTGLFTKKDYKTDPGLEAFAIDMLAPIFCDAKKIHGEFERKDNSFDAALKHLDELSLLLAIRRTINSQGEELGRFILADTAPMLNGLTESDTSFVFEKTGTFIRHLMIDEFQDTSRMQWKNLRLLIHECLSQNQDCLVVGDVKQSIYRWRNGDWNILNSEIENCFANYSPRVEPLKMNRRSNANIIEFNNKVFPIAAKELAIAYRTQFGHEYDALSRAYRDVVQDIPKADDGNGPQKSGGSVRVRLVRKARSDTDKALLPLQMIEEELDRLLDKGVKPGDITILLRNKNDISTIANHFAVARPDDLPMVSGEAFQLDSSHSVRIMVNAMRWIEDETDQAALASLVYEWRHCILHDQVSADDILRCDLPGQLPDDITAKREELRNLPMYELAEYLFRTLKLDGADGQDAYVLSFLDIVRDFPTGASSELGDFIDAWDEKLHKKAIPSNGSGSIRLMTIHKSKGLEFHTVIIPYCDWPITKSGDKLWCEPSEEPFNALPLLPVDYSKRLGNSVFSMDYEQETGRQMVDNLNLLYVALTRPKCNCIIISAEAPGKTATGASAISDILSSSLSQAFGCGEDENGIQTFELGDVIPTPDPRTEQSPKPKSKNPLDAIPEKCNVPMKSYGLDIRFRQSGESQRFVHSLDDEAADDIQEQNGYIENGKMMHQLMSAIRTADDIDREVRKMLAEGVIESSEKAESIRRFVHDFISSPDTCGWFDGHWTLFNEASVLFRHNGRVQTRRPDRVMSDGNETLVIDFKFAREKEDHMHQVQEYMTLLSDMGFKNIKGYVWYVYQHKIINC